MKNKLFSIVPVFFLLTLLANPQVRFVNPQIDLGKINIKEVYKQTFIFENTGTEILVIDRIKTSCGCATSSYSKEPIQPGSKGEIVVTYKPKKTDKGFISKSFTIDFNEGALREYIYLKGTIE